VSWTILLDSGPLGLVTHRKGVPGADDCRQWVAACLDHGARILVPAIADYEVRRELARANRSAGLARLDAFNTAEPDRYLPLTDAALRLAATLWARARQQGKPTADPRELDCDVVLAAQALTLAPTSSRIVVATMNIGHLSQFVAAALWTDIDPATAPNVDQ
jgi:predicted nucleic acid-binding protein